MPTPPKPVDLLVLEGKSHRTKDELQQRREAEASLITGVPMKPWKSLDREAKKEFKRIKGLLAKIGKDDALYEGSINRYCQLKSECREIEETKEAFLASKEELQKEYREGKLDDEKDGMTASQYYKLLVDIQKNIVGLDRQLMTKRKMMLDIEKEDIMTIASALRSIPKKVPKEEKKSGIAGFQKRRADVT